jgi:RimJ/RimL family protein N-acetyltransferase
VNLLRTGEGPGRFTERLLLVAATPDHLRAELESPSKLGGLLNAEVPGDWPPGEYDRNAQEFFHDRMEHAESSAAGWYVWYAVLRPADGGRATLIGTGGFLGPPSDAGEVEIGYSLSEAWRGKGFAKEMVSGLVSQALSDPRVTRLVAHTKEQNAPSRSVLEGTGFHAAGAGSEPGSLRYELHRPSTGRSHPTEVSLFPGPERQDS